MKKANIRESRSAGADPRRAVPTHSANVAKDLQARKLAVSALNSFERTCDTTAENVLARAFDHADLSQRDRAFARNLVATSLRRQGQIDSAIGACLDRPLSGQVLAVRNILRLGACQILFLGTPSHAAVDSAVRLCEAGPNRRFKGLVNAVLRRLSREGDAILKGQDAARLNTPDWLWNSWSVAYGNDTCRAIAEAHLTERPLDITVKSDPEGWAARLGGTVLAGGSVRIWPRGPISDLDGFAEGGWWVQDAAAALPVRLLGNIADKRVIDLCAAPGGKTAQLAAAGARVTAVDRSRTRADRLRHNLERLRLSAEIVTADAVTWRPETPVDAVILDAPCSSTGTIRRHPDIAWSKSHKQVRALETMQNDLLSAAADMVAPQGTIIYCVCSLQPEEGPERIADFAGRVEGIDLAPIQPSEFPDLAQFIAPSGHLRTLPCHLARDGGVDGFFAARFTRRRN